MIILDTNVVSELFKPYPNAQVVAKLKSYSSDDIFISAITVTELRFGLLTMLAGRNRLLLEQKIVFHLSHVYAGKIVPFDMQAAEQCAVLLAKNRGTIPRATFADLQIAATALARKFAVATRNVSDFAHDGLTVINPWVA